MIKEVKAKQYWCLILGRTHTQLAQFRLQPNNTITLLNQRQWRTERLKKSKGKPLRQYLDKHSKVLVLLPSFLCHFFQVSLDKAFNQLEKTQFIQQLVAEKTQWPNNHTLLIEEAMSLSTGPSDLHSIWTTNSATMLQLFPFELLLTTGCKRLECLQMTLAWLVYKFERDVIDEYWGVIEFQDGVGGVLLYKGKQLIYQKSWQLNSELENGEAKSTESELLRKFEQKLLQTFTLLPLPQTVPLYGLDSDLKALRSIHLAERLNLKSMTGLIPDDDEGRSVCLGEVTASSALLTKHLYVDM